MAETLVELIQEGKDITIHLTETERTRLVECEQIINKNLKTFLEVGHALAEIRDNRLYRETHQTFEKYCKEVWDITRMHAHNQIRGYETVRLIESKCKQLFTKSADDPDSEMSTITDKNPESMPCCDEILAGMAEKCGSCEHKKRMASRAFKGVNIPWGPGKCTRPEGLCMEAPEAREDRASEERVQVILPINEAQTRPLTKLKNPDDQVAAWGIVLEQLNDGKKLTAALINKAVKEVRGEVAIRKMNKTKQKLEATQLVSNLFKKQYQVLLDILSDEQNNGWRTTSKKEAVLWLKNLVKIAESED